MSLLKSFQDLIAYKELSVLHVIWTYYWHVQLNYSYFIYLALYLFDETSFYS